MSKGAKIGIVSILLIADLFLTLLFYNKKYMNYAIICGTILVVLVILLLFVIIKKTDKEAIYNSSLKKVMKVYDAILVQSNNFPDFRDKTIIRITNFEDMVDAQIEVRKPILYKKQSESCSFILLDQNQAMIYIMKMREDVISPLEIILREVELKKNKKDKDYDYSILSDIDKTTIVKLENNKAYKVSPIRKKTNLDETIELL